VSQEPSSSTAVPGGSPVEHVVHVRNEGDTVEEYRFTVVGPLARFAAVEPTELRLYPGDEGTTTVTFTVPKDREALAGPTPFGVQVVPRVHPEISDVIEGTVTVSPFAEMRADMSPVTVRGRLSARLQLSVENRGNAPLPVTLQARDQEDALRFDDVAGPVWVPPGTTAWPSLTVRPRRRRLTKKPERFPLTVQVVPSQDAERAGARAVALRATFVRLRFAPAWVLVGIVALVLAGLLAGGTVYVVKQVAATRLSLPTTSGSQTAGAPPPPPAQNGGRSQNGTQSQNGSGGSTTVLIAHNGEALTAKGAANGLTPQTTRQGGDGQDWKLLTTQGGGRVITPGGDGSRALDQRTAADGTPLDLTALDTGKVSRSQVWTVKPTGSGGEQATIVNSATGDCLTDAGDGRTVVGATCQPGAAKAQVWNLTGS
jgi:hypothetical protein